MEGLRVRDIMIREVTTLKRNDKLTVLRKNSAPVMQHPPVGCTRDEVRSVRSAQQLGLVGGNDASGVADACWNLAADRESQAPKRSVVGLDCNVVATTTGSSEDAPRTMGLSNPYTHAEVSRLVFRTANLPLGSARVFQ